MLKKIFACLLTAALLMSLAACGEPADIRGEVIENDPTTVPATTQPQETTQAPTVAPTEAPTEPTFSIGSASGNTYKNEFIGIQCVLDGNWVFKTDEEMRQINQITSDLVDEEYKNFVSNLTVVQDMMAVNTNQMDTINVVLEKLSGANLFLTADQYMSLSKDATVNALASMGLNIVSAEVTKVQFAGEEHAALVIQADVEGIAVYEVLLAIKCNGYMACVTACTWIENTCMDILNKFEAC